MLVLSRKRFQQIRIGTEIRITIVRVDGGNVRLGIEAPSRLSVFRGELLEKNPSAERKTPPPARRDAGTRGE
jgi:carbon storage regulator